MKERVSTCPRCGKVIDFDRWRNSKCFRGICPFRGHKRGRPRKKRIEP